MSRVGTDSFLVGSRLSSSRIGTRSQVQKTKCTAAVTVLTALMLIAGTVSMTSFKLQGDRYNFKRGAYQAFIMFVGEWFNLLVFFMILV